MQGDEIRPERRANDLGLGPTCCEVGHADDTSVRSVWRTVRGDTEQPAPQAVLL